MAKTKTKAKQTPETDAGTRGEGRVPSAEMIEAAGAGNIGQIRDILFGGQMRAYEQRFARLEQRLNKDAAELKSQFKRRLDALEDFIKSEIETLGTQLQSEQTSRIKAAQELTVELKQTATDLEQATTRLDDALARSTREFRQQLLEQSKRLTEEISQSSDQTRESLEQTSQELRGDKVDRTTLSNLLAEISMRLVDDQSMKAIFDSVDPDDGP